MQPEKLSFLWWRHDFVNPSNKSNANQNVSPTKQKHFQQTNYYPMPFANTYTHIHNDDDIFVSLLVGENCIICIPVRNKAILHAHHRRTTEGRAE